MTDGHGDPAIYLWIRERQRTKDLDILCLLCSLNDEDYFHIHYLDDDELDRQTDGLTYGRTREPSINFVRIFFYTCYSSLHF